MIKLYFKTNSVVDLSFTEKYRHSLIIIEWDPLFCIKSQERRPTRGEKIKALSLWAKPIEVDDGALSQGNSYKMIIYRSGMIMDKENEGLIRKWLKVLFNHSSKLAKLTTLWHESPKKGLLIYQLQVTCCPSIRAKIYEWT